MSGWRWWSFRRPSNNSRPSSRPHSSRSTVVASCVANLDGDRNAHVVRRGTATTDRGTPAGRSVNTFEVPGSGHAQLAQHADDLRAQAVVVPLRVIVALVVGLPAVR